MNRNHQAKEQGAELMYTSSVIKDNKQRASRSPEWLKGNAHKLIDKIKIIICLITSI